MPPIANHGTVSVAAAARRRLETARDRILLRRRRERGDPDVVRAGDVVELGRRRDGEPEQPIGTDERTRLVDRHVTPADVDAVGTARLDEVGTVVEDEERAVRARTPRGTARGGDERIVVELLVPQLDDVDAAAQRRFEDVSVTAGEHEIEAGATQLVAHEHMFA